MSRPPQWNKIADRKLPRYVGRRGPSWLVRWAVTEGRTVEPQPAIPAWVREATR